jgi:putative salt-induced outer membrane protein YdiY
MLRAKRTALLLNTITLFSCLLVFLTWTTANARDASPPDSSTEVSQGAETTAADPQEEKEVSPPPDVMAPPMMTPGKSAPAYDRKKHDWVRLTSGEWLKGDIVSMRNDKFEFDSDEMDEQSFDWEDIAELRSSRKYTYVLTNRTSLIGTALILDKDVVISVNGEDRVLKRADLMSIVPAGEGERDRWDGKMSLGVAFRHGNTNQSDLTFQAFVRRRDALTRVRLDSNGAIGEVEGEQTVNNHRLILKLDLFVSPRFYITPLSVILYHDKFQNIDIQVTPYAGVGYHALKRKKAEMDLELAGGYQYTRYKSVEEGADGEERSGAILPVIRIETDPLKAVDLDVFCLAAITVPDPEDTAMHGEVILSIEITKIFDLDVSWIWDRVQNPQPNEDGTVPKQDDVKLTVGIGIDF